jgi:PadR family transcriptional regulator PadR
MLNNYEQTLLTGWEDLYKKGQLSMWILLALKDGPKSMNDIKKFINHVIHGHLNTDDKSMYRTLRRFAQAEIIEFTPAPITTICAG